MLHECGHEVNPGAVGIESVEVPNRPVLLHHIQNDRRQFTQEFEITFTKTLQGKENTF
jgi:hypothetical protein